MFMINGLQGFEECSVPGVRELPRNCAQAQILDFLRSHHYFCKEICRNQRSISNRQVI